MKRILSLMLLVLSSIALCSDPELTPGHSRSRSNSNELVGRHGDTPKKALKLGDQPVSKFFVPEVSNRLKEDFSKTCSQDCCIDSFGRVEHASDCKRNGLNHEQCHADSVEQLKENFDNVPSTDPVLSWSSTIARHPYKIIITGTCVIATCAYVGFFWLRRK